MHLPLKSSDCQLAMRDLSGTFKTNPAYDLHRERPQFIDHLEDDTNPDLIPNQYGK